MGLAPNQGRLAAALALVSCGAGASPETAAAGAPAADWSRTGAGKQKAPSGPCLALAGHTGDAAHAHAQAAEEQFGQIHLHCATSMSQHGSTQHKAASSSRSAARMAVG